MARLVRTGNGQLPEVCCSLEWHLKSETAEDVQSWTAEACNVNGGKTGSSENHGVYLDRTFGRACGPDRNFLVLVISSGIGLPCSIPRSTAQR